jgi:ammonium transporter
LLFIAPAPGLAEAETPPAQSSESPQPPKPDTGDTAWMLISSALVMLMIPGLALFYGGMVRQKNLLATMMHSMIALAIAGVFWIAIGYNLAFGHSMGGFIGWSNDLVFLHGLKPDELLPNATIPVYVHVLFQGMFAIITPALISGAVAERIRFGPYCLFVLLWVACVYCPLAHWVWAMDWYGLEAGARGAGKTLVGWLGAAPGDGGLGALDFAGGTVVHIAAGFSGLAAILVLRKRLGYPEHAIHPSSMVLTLFGAGLLWFGWFGFNGGSAGSAGFLAASAFAATQAAAAAGGLTWVMVEWLHRGKPTALGLASGIVAGLVAVTPASGYVMIWAGLLIGLLAGAACYLAVFLKAKLGYDDSLDAFGVHGVGGFLGAVLTGLLCTAAVNTSAVTTEGLFYGGGMAQALAQLLAAAAAAAVAFFVSLVLVKLVVAVAGFACDPRSEVEGLDRTEHGEAAFHFGPGLETAAAETAAEPRPAVTPRNGDTHFAVVVEGADTSHLMQAWSELCQNGNGPPSPEFKAVYPYFTTVQGNRFRFRGGDAELIQRNMQQLLGPRLPRAVRTRIE